MARVKSRGKSTRRYFIEVFTARPELLRESSNDAAISQWEKDNPGEECTPSIKSSISNVKTYLRSQNGLGNGRRKNKKRGRPPGQANGFISSTLGRKLSPSALEKLEILIDECLSQARQNHSSELDKVIQHLRLARNTIVYKQGKFDHA